MCSVWQDADDLQRLLGCMEANGLVPEPGAMQVVACPPYEYLQTAEYNSRPVGFIPKGTQVCAAHSVTCLMPSTARPSKTSHVG